MDKRLQILLAIVVGGFIGSATVNAGIVNTIIVFLSRMIK
jgi:hypothetical protein